MYEPEPTAQVASMTLALFTAMVDRHQHALCAFLHHLLGDAEQAADLMQDTFQEAWRAAQAQTAPFVTNCADDERQRWLFQVAYHRGISALLHYDGKRWNTAHLPAFKDTSAYALAGISMVSPTEGWAVGWSRSQDGSTPTLHSADSPRSQWCLECCAKLTGCAQRREA